MHHRLTSSILRRCFDVENVRFGKSSLARGENRELFLVVDVPYENGRTVMEAIAADAEGGAGVLPVGVRMAQCEMLPSLVQEREMDWLGGSEDGGSSNYRDGGRYGARGGGGGGSGSGYRDRAGGGSGGGGYRGRSEGSGNTWGGSRTGYPGSGEYRSRGGYAAAPSSGRDGGVGRSYRESSY